jgi:hypothetical protein
MDAARNSPVYKMAVDWKVALPLHPEYRTLPMVWYVPPLSPITAAANAGQLGSNGEIPDVKQLRIPVKYLANLLTAGDTAPVVRRSNACWRCVRISAQSMSKAASTSTFSSRSDDPGGSRRDVSRDGHRQLRRPLRDPDQPPRICREHFQRARWLWLLVRQRLLRRNRRDQPVRQREAAHDSDQGGGLSDVFAKIPAMAITLRVLARLLSYPDADLRQHLERDAPRTA